MFSTSVAVLRSSEIRFVPFFSDCAETTKDSVIENPASSASFMFSAIADAVLSDEKNAAVGLSGISFLAGSLKRKKGLEIFWIFEKVL